jgi:hypothetical protein
LGLALLPGSACAQQASLKDQLIGTWTFVSFVQVRPDGSKFLRFGDNPKGINVFDPDGRFFVMMARPDLPKFAAGDPMKATAAETEAIVHGTFAYFGTYSVDEASKSITLHIEASTFPNQIGDQKRTVTLITADELKYGNSAALSGGSSSFEWRRAK